MSLEKASTNVDTAVLYEESENMAKVKLAQKRDEVFLNVIRKLNRI